MAEPLKNYFGPEIPKKIAGMISSVMPDFDADGFVRDALDGYDELELTPRGWKIARTLRKYLPEDYEAAIEILLASLGPRIKSLEGNGMAPFLYMPHVFFVAEFGLEHFEASMRAQYELTQRFTAEFSIRAFLDRYPEKTLERLREWTHDPNLHVRRLVSEGTRPLLPWAPRLRRFQKDPAPVLELLELLKDDPELYVRRSVANNLNDIGKDHPKILVETARGWMKDASENREWLVRHALRSAIKRADPGALAILGYEGADNISFNEVSLSPAKPAIGQSVVLSFEVKNDDAKKRRLLIDCRVHFIKANGKTSPKVFKLKTAELAQGESVKIQKSISLAQLTTRKHYPGTHQVEVVLNGVTKPLGAFELVQN